MKKQLFKHPIDLLKSKLDELHIEYEYNENEPSLVVSFAHKDKESIHIIDYKSIEIEYDEQKDKLILSMYTHFNMRDYHQLPQFVVTDLTWPTDSVYLQTLAITLKYYIKTTEADLKIIDQMKSV